MATTTKTWPTKWICATLNFFALIPSWILKDLVFWSLGKEKASHLVFMSCAKHEIRQSQSRAVTEKKCTKKCETCASCFA